jgi:hypothetical protein
VGSHLMTFADVAKERFGFHLFKNVLRSLICKEEFTSPN